MKHFELLISDLDSTLYDEIDYVKSGFRSVAARLGELNNTDKEGIYSELTEIFMNGRRTDTFQEYIKANGLQERILDEIVSVYRNHRPAIILGSDKMEILRRIKSEGIKIAVITNGDVDRQEMKIDVLGLKGVLDYYVITGKYSKSREFWKPNPRGYEEILRKLNCIPGNTIFVGDNPEIDFEYPLKSGMVTLCTDEYRHISTGDLDTNIKIIHNFSAITQYLK